MAEEEPIACQQPVSETGIKDQNAATNMRLAYVRTGNPEIDTMSDAGLRGLGIMLFEHSSVENIVQTPRIEGERPAGFAFAQLMPAAVDIEQAIFPHPVLFWTIDPRQSMPSDKAIRNLNSYIRNGGVLVIDTRDKSTSRHGAAWLRQVVDRGLEIGALEKVEGCADKDKPCHVLGKSLYLQKEFPGRYNSSPVWVEHRSDDGGERVSPVIIGGNEWVAAWATDGAGRYCYAIANSDEEVRKEQRKQAFQFGVNLVMHILAGNYKEDAVHIPAILERMGPK